MFQSVDSEAYMQSFLLLSVAILNVAAKLSHKRRVKNGRLACG